MRLSFNNLLWDYPSFLFSKYISQDHLQDGRSSAQETRWCPRYLVAISHVYSFATEENTLGEEQGKPGEIPTRFSNSLAETVKSNKIQLSEEAVSSKQWVVHHAKDADNQVVLGVFWYHL